MDKYREAFERKGNIKIFVKLCMFDDSINEYSSDKLHDYTLGFVNGAWWAFQEQQKQIDGLQMCVGAVKNLAQIFWEKSNEKHKQEKIWESKALSECADEILDVLERVPKGGEA